MRGIETSKEKVRKICDILRKETLEPVQQEAALLIRHAQEEAERIIAEAEKKAAEALERNRAEIEKQKAIFQVSVTQSYRQAIEQLKQEIEKHLFQPQLARLLHQKMKEPSVLARLIDVMVEAIRKGGINAELSAYVPSEISPEEVNALIAKEILQQIREKSVLLSTIGGGVRVKLHDEDMTIELTDQSVREMLEAYLRSDFRELIFRNA